MKNWAFTTIRDNKIRMDKWLTDIMGLVEGGYIYSSLFKHPEKGPKRYELILSMYPQENFRALTRVDVYMEDVPGATVQSAKFLATQGINVLNSVSLNGISETTIIWNIMCELNFAGEGDIIKERFAKMKADGDPSVSMIRYVSIKPANIGRMFRKESEGHVKEEIRHGSPSTFHSGTFDLNVEYGDILNDVEGTEVMIIVDPSSWLVSVVFFKPDTKLIRVNIDIPDCPGSINVALEPLAMENINLISIFSKVVISYQLMSLEVVADMKNSGKTLDQLREMFDSYLSEQNGIFKVVGISSLG
ncbi:MAG: ACT domain protein [Methanomassiliicoccaceae archaeon]|jgi:ACT domain-containing protein|nr:ACT domain protein [Methanomassiliicoccaceae archaeon]